MAVDQLSKNNPDGTVLGQSITDKISVHGKTTIVQPASANQAATGPAAPAGGTGAAAGGYDTAANRDLAIVLLNETRVLVNEMRTVLVNAGWMKGAA